MDTTTAAYVVITPVRDEEAHIEETLQSMVAQTLKPKAWIIVDDGSTDHTQEIVTPYVKDFPFIQLLRNPHAGVRQPGSAVIRAFNYGYASLREVSYEYIVKLDGDLSFESDYFEKLLAKFQDDNSLGIASGIYFEMDISGSWTEVKMPSYHAAGACKVLRQRCYEEIRGFVSAAGWDTVDEIRAMTGGWKTRHFSDLHMRHHKHEGSGIGAIRTSLMHGMIYYRIGGSIIFFLLKILHRMGTRPYVISALALSWGYIRARLNREELLVTREEALCYQILLRERLLNRVKTLIALS